MLLMLSSYNEGDDERREVCALHLSDSVSSAGGLTGNTGQGPTSDCQPVGRGLLGAQ